MAFTKIAKPSASFSKVARPIVEVWAVQYEANELPAAATPVWTKEGTFATEEISPPGFLHIAIDVGNYAFYGIKDAAIDSAIGSTFEARLKIISASDASDVILGLADSAHYWQINFYTDKIIIRGSDIEEEDQIYEMDTTDDHHVYRITKQGTAIKIYVDGTLRLTGTAGPNASGTGSIEFGGYSENASEFLWDYVYYRTDGAFKPTYKKEAKPSASFSKVAKPN